MLDAEVPYKVMLTTFDNPYDPFTNFTQWYLYDMEKDYCSCAYLAREAHISDQLSDVENETAQEEAIDEIIKYDFRNIYKKVKKPIE